MDDELCEVIITAPDKDWLIDFVKRLTEDRLCAGSHTLSEIRSVYRWDGQVWDRTEGRVAAGG